MPSLMDILGFAGDVMDTPGRLTRTALAGRNPLDALFDPSQGVSGRDLLQQYGLVGENQDGFDAGDVGGFAAEMALDPMNLIGGGMLARLLGKASRAKAANRGMEAANAVSLKQRLQGFMPEEVAKNTLSRMGNKVQPLYRTTEIAEKTAPAFGVKKSPRIASPIELESELPEFDFMPSKTHLATHYADIQKPMEGWKTYSVDDLLKRAPSGSKLEALLIKRQQKGDQLLQNAHNWREFLQKYGDDVASNRAETGYKQARATLNPNGSEIAAELGPSANKELQAAGFDSFRKWHRRSEKTVVFNPSQVYLPYIAKELQALRRVPNAKPLLAALLGHNAVARSNGAN